MKLDPSIDFTGAYLSSQPTYKEIKDKKNTNKSERKMRQKKKRKDNIAKAKGKKSR